MKKALGEFLGNPWFGVVTTTSVVLVGLDHLPPGTDKWWVVGSLVTLAISGIVADFRAYLNAEEEADIEHDADCPVGKGQTQ